MLTVKIVYANEEGVEKSFDLECRRFTVDDIAASFEHSCNSEFIQISPIRSHFLSDDVMIFILDSGDMTIGGYAKVTKREVKTVRDSYDSGICPDCQEEIALETEDGDECPNCGHIFYIEED